MLKSSHLANELLIFSSQYQVQTEDSNLLVLPANGSSLFFCCWRFEVARDILKYKADRSDVGTVPLGYWG